MSVQASSWVIKYSQHKGSTLLVLLMIANHAHADGSNAFPSLKTLARECRMSERQITRIVKILEDSGELSVDHSRGRAAHTYAVNMTPNPDKMSTLNPDNLSPSEDPTLTFSTSNPDISGDPTLTFSAKKSAHIRNEPSLEPSEKGAAPKPKVEIEDEILVIETESKIGFKLGIDTKRHLIKSVPKHLREHWPDYLADRLVGFKGKPRDSLEQKLGYTLTDFKRDYRQQFEMVKKNEQTKLPSATEYAAEQAKHKATPGADPKEFMRGLRGKGQDNSKTLTGN